MDTLNKRYWYLAPQNSGLGRHNKILDDHGRLSRQTLLHNNNLGWECLREVRVEVNCCRKRHTVILTDTGQLCFPYHTNMEELEMIAQWGSDKARCLDVKNNWMKVMRDDCASARKLLPKPLQEASRQRRDLSTVRDRFYQDVRHELNNGLVPCSERFHSPVVAIRKGPRRRNLRFAVGEDAFRFFGVRDHKSRFEDTARKFFHEMADASSQARDKSMHYPGRLHRTIKSWWIEVQRLGLNKAMYMGTTQRVPVYAAMPIEVEGDVVTRCTVILGTGTDWGREVDLKWGMAFRDLSNASNDGQWFILEYIPTNPNNNPTIDEG